MPRLIWTKEAAKDVERLHQFLLHKNPKAARKAAESIRKAAVRLNEMPELGKPMGDDSDRRELMTSFGKTGYVLRYRTDAHANPIILRVWHGLEKR